MKLAFLGLMALSLMGTPVMADGGNCSCDKACQKVCASGKGEGHCQCKACDCAKTGKCSHGKCHQEKDK